MEKILLFLLFVGGNSLDFESFKEFEECYMRYEEAGKNILLSVDDSLRFHRDNMESFMIHIHNNPIVENLMELRITGRCPAGYMDVVVLRQAFNSELSQLETPIKERVSTLRSLYMEANENLKLYKGLAESRWWVCKMKGSECTKDVEQWLHSTLDSFMCSKVSRCSDSKVQKNCDNGTAESPSNNNQCSTGEFRCQNSKCIGMNLTCNGLDDCGDGSDEMGCSNLEIHSQKNCSIHSGRYQCASNDCVGLSLVCDGNDNCGDGSDEGGLCGIGACHPSCGEMGGVCFRGPRGPLCLSSCPPGTYNSPKGCLFKHELETSTISELLEDLPWLMERQIRGYNQLRRKTVDTLSVFLDSAVRCRGDIFTMLKTLRTLDDLVKPTREWHESTDPVVQTN